MCVSPTDCRAEMYADRVACCPLVSDVEYAPRALLRLEKRQDKQTGGRTPDRYITLTARRGQTNKESIVVDLTAFLRGYATLNAV